MCSRGVFQLRKLSLFFCDFGGSSQGVRNLLMTSKLRQFMHNNKHINFQYICKRNSHPFVTAVYLNGYIKDKPLRNLSQQQTLQAMVDLNNQLGKGSIKASGVRVYGAKESIQGQWVANMFNTYPVASYQTVHKIPRPQYTIVQKPAKTYEKKKQVDINSKLQRIKEPHFSGLRF